MGVMVDQEGWIMLLLLAIEDALVWSPNPTWFLECEILKSKIVPKFLDMVRMAIWVVLINLIVCCIKGGSGLRGSNGQAAKPCEVTRWEQESTTCQAFLILPPPVGEQRYNSWREAIHLPKDPSCSSQYILGSNPPISCGRRPTTVGEEPNNCQLGNLPLVERVSIMRGEEPFSW